MQCDFTDLRINQTVASRRSQVEVHWNFANEVLRPEILVYVTTYLLSSGSCCSNPLQLSTSKIICVLNDCHLVKIDYCNILSFHFPYLLYEEAMRIELNEMQHYLTMSHSGHQSTWCIKYRFGQWLTQPRPT